MTTLKIKILTLTLVLLNFTLFGQTEKLTAIQKDSLFSIRWEKEQDSLRTEFYRQPKLIKLTFERNGEEKPIAGLFIINIDKNEFELKPKTVGQYQMDFAIDSSQTIIIKLVTAKDTFIQQLSRPTEIKNGATIVFGIVTDIQKQSKKGIRKPRNEDDELSKRDKFYNSIFQNERILNLARQRKIKRIEYIHVTPRVYGCGTITKYLKY